MDRVQHVFAHVRRRIDRKIAIERTQEAIEHTRMLEEKSEAARLSFLSILGFTSPSCTRT